MNKILCRLSFFFRCDSIEKIRGKIDYLRNLLNDPVTFKNIYRYAYDFARVSYINSEYLLIVSYITVKF